MTAVWLMACAMVAADPVGAAKVAKPEMLAQAAALVKAGPSNRLVYLDARSRADYLAGHIPGARWVDLDAWSKAVNNGDDRKAWEARIGGVGVDAGTAVVVYGASKPLESARLWWILRYWGVKDVRLLDGGFASWQAAGGKTGRTAERSRAARADLEAGGRPAHHPRRATAGAGCEEGRADRRQPLA
ncbi:MAG: rhodanese-like domain-containing protein [Gemmataceae bacterium]